MPQPSPCPRGTVAEVSKTEEKAAVRNRQPKANHRRAHCPRSGRRMMIPVRVYAGDHSAKSLPRSPLLNPAQSSTRRAKSSSSQKRNGVGTCSTRAIFTATS